MNNGDDFHAGSQRFLEWFESIPGSTFHESISIVDLRDRKAGRGIVASADIAADTLLFTIPRGAIINVTTSELPRALPSIFAGDSLEEDAEPLDSWGALILVMMYEHLRGSASRWRPYLDVLPEQFDTPMFWAPEELRELQASPMVSKIGNDDVDDMIRTKLLPVVSANPALFFPDGGVLGEAALLGLARRMGSIIMAYAFDLELDDEQPQEEDDEWMEDKEGRIMLGMVPMADILNADAEFNAHVNHAEDSLTVTSLRPIRAGEEVLNYYGPHPNSELLRRYGYITPKHARHDVVDIPWSLVVSILKDHLGLQDDTWERVAGQVDPDEVEEFFIIERDSGEPDSNGLHPEPAVLHELPSDLEEQLKAFLKVVKKLDADLVPDKRKRDEICHAIIAKALEARLGQYATSIAEDESILAQPAIAPRRRMAVEVRLGEKRLLVEARALLTDPSDPEPEPERASKKARTAE